MRRQDRRRLLYQVVAQYDWVTVRRLVEMTGLADKTCRAYLSDMVRDGELFRPAPGIFCADEEAAKFIAFIFERFVPKSAGEERTWLGHVLWTRRELHAFGECLRVRIGIAKTPFQVDLLSAVGSRSYLAIQLAAGVSSEASLPGATVMVDVGIIDGWRRVVRIRDRDGRVIWERPSSEQLPPPYTLFTRTPVRTVEECDR